MPKNTRGSKRTDPYYQAQDILSRRDHSIAEVRQKLGRKKFSREQIEAVVRRLIQEELLNDERFATMYTADMLRFKTVGPRWVATALLQKNIDRDIVARVVAEAYPSGTEAALAKKAAKAWQGSHRGVAHDQMRLWRFLAARGFSSASISAATQLTDDH